MKRPIRKIFLSHTFRFSLATHLFKSKPRLILIADIYTLKHGTCTPMVLHIMGLLLGFLSWPMMSKGQNRVFTVEVSL